MDTQSGGEMPVDMCGLAHTTDDHGPCLLTCREALAGAGSEPRCCCACWDAGLTAGIVSGACRDAGLTA
jgi:hypothetical protein